MYLFRGGQNGRRIWRAVSKQTGRGVIAASVQAAKVVLMLGRLAYREIQITKWPLGWKT